jgi:hypothetical protein
VSCAGCLPCNLAGVNFAHSVLDEIFKRAFKSLESFVQNFNFQFLSILFDTVRFLYAVLKTPVIPGFSFAEHVYGSGMLDDDGLGIKAATGTCFCNEHFRCICFNDTVTTTTKGADPDQVTTPKSEPSRSPAPPGEYRARQRIVMAKVLPPCGRVIFSEKLFAPWRRLVAD